MGDKCYCCQESGCQPGCHCWSAQDEADDERKYQEHMAYQKKSERRAKREEARS